ncbi:MAG: FtsX-like permease family protein [Hydrococcus sp. SU_1_0]|nr:FtsX-like permease family protein [Hydrococcus sp. SU_1_0]NJO97980.1 FtsX-like permease family protein [Pleurocapsa sp. CRU_1_2]
MTISLPDLIFITCKSLYTSPLRSGLTMLGVFMGVSAVSATLNVGGIAEAKIQAKLADRDRPYIVPYLTPQGNFGIEELDREDKQALEQNVADIRSISSLTQVYLQSAQFEGQEATDIQALGVSENYVETTGRKVLEGRFFNETDFTNYRPVAIIDRQMANLLFEGSEAVDKDIYADGTRLTIVGIIETKSDGSDFQSSGTLWLPQTFAEVLQGGFSSGALQIGSHQLEDIPQLKEQIEQILTQRHPKAMVYLQDNTEDLLREQELQQTAAKALYVVALIALSIGGVGIANISIASVMERIKEIGLRRAIGATQGEVMAQFILEATVLSLVGGTLAIATVHGLTVTATTKFIPAPYQFSHQRAALSLGSAILVGVGASFFPALKASRVDVIQALRTN